MGIAEGGQALGVSRHAPVTRGRERPGAARPRPSATLPPVTAPRTLDALLGRPIPDLTLADTRGADYRLRQFVSRRPLVLFFYIMNGTPG